MKGIFVICAMFTCIPLFADNDNTGENREKVNTVERLEIINEVPSTPVRDQYKSSTCWSFCTISMLESELIRMDGEEVDLSEMFIVRRTYERKAERYIRMHGKINFAPGGEANDVTDAIEEYGIMPESVYSGLKMKDKNHIHNQMDKELEEYVMSVIADPSKEINTSWKKGYSEILDAYLGKIPKKFEYQGKKYTPQTFAEHLGIKPENYIMVTSFSHQPYYQPFILEVPDNWSWGHSYNLPLIDMEQLVDSALSNGYSLAWAADVSEEGFSFENGYAVAPKSVYSPGISLQKSQWEKLTIDSKNEKIFSSNRQIKEIEVDQAVRQEAFDNFTTTDDHGMHIVGIARDSNNKQYYYVKNSWGPENPYEGYLYVSKPYFLYKTISVMVHKDAIPSEIAKKLGILN